MSPTVPFCLLQNKQILDKMACVGAVAVNDDSGLAMSKAHLPAGQILLGPWASRDQGLG